MRRNYKRAKPFGRRIWGRNNPLFPNLTPSLLGEGELAQGVRYFTVLTAQLRRLA
jgi:hypothetical protein